MKFGGADPSRNVAATLTLYISSNSKNHQKRKSQDVTLYRLLFRLDAANGYFLIVFFTLKFEKGFIKKELLNILELFDYFDYLSILVAFNFEVRKS